MRHGNSINKLSRTNSHRRALLANMAISLIEHKRIRTTLAKAKALRQYVEPLITKAKSDTTHSRRVVFSYLTNKEALKELFGEIGPKVASRPGGYTRILKLGARLGDAAEMAMIELVDYNEYLAGGSIREQKTTRRRRPAAGKKAAPAAPKPAAVEAAIPEVAFEEVAAETAPPVVQAQEAPTEAAAPQPEPADEQQAEAPNEEPKA